MTKQMFIVACTPIGVMVYDNADNGTRIAHLSDFRPYASERVLKSSSMDYPEDYTDDAATLALVRDINEWFLYGIDL